MRVLIQREEREVGDDGVGPSWQLRASEREMSGVRGRSGACLGRIGQRLAGPRAALGPSSPRSRWCVCVCFKKHKGTIAE